MAVCEYEKGESRFRWRSNAFKIGFAGIVLLVFGAIFVFASYLITGALSQEDVNSFAGFSQKILFVSSWFSVAGWVIGSIGIGLLVVAVLVHWFAPDTLRLKWFAQQRLFSSRFGNPLGLKDGQVLPRIEVKRDTSGLWLSIWTTSNDADQIARVSLALSGAARGKLRGYAVTVIDTDSASSFVRFKFEDVTVDRSITVHSLEDLNSGDVTKLLVDHGTCIDLTRSGSMLAVGVTRSGKTSGVLALLLQVARFGRDDFGSRVVIVDPKVAELSQVSHTVTLDEKGSARPVLGVMRELEQVMKSRQALLNAAAAESGSPVKWWDYGMHPTFLFIDEFVALRSVFPARATKDDGGYNLKEFEDSLKRLITMGASAGVFVIVSIAQASTENLPSLFRDAFSTRFLFRPKRDQARFLWDSRVIDNMPERVYRPGDAWFTSEDGVHDAITFVHFPYFAPDFGEYGELSQLLRAYYSEQKT